MVNKKRLHSARSRYISGMNTVPKIDLSELEAAVSVMQEGTSIEEPMTNFSLEVIHEGLLRLTSNVTKRVINLPLTGRCPMSVMAGFAKRQMA